MYPRLLFHILFCSLAVLISTVGSAQEQSTKPKKDNTRTKKKVLFQLLNNPQPKRYFIGTVGAATGGITVPTQKKAKPKGGSVVRQVLVAGTDQRHPGPTDIVRIYYRGQGVSSDMRYPIQSHCKGPAVVPINQLIPGLQKGIQQMTVGEVARLRIPSSLAFSPKTGRPGSVAGDLFFEVQLLEILDPFNYRASDGFPPPKVSLPSVAHWFTEKSNHVDNSPLSFLSILQFWDDGEAVTMYHKGPPNSAVKDSSGLAYLVHQKGHGAHPQVGDTVEVKYYGSRGLFYFDTSDTCDSTALWPTEMLIPGLRRSILMMQEGETRELWIPPELAYGSGPEHLAQPGGALVFSVELVRIHRKANSPRQ